MLDFMTCMVVLMSNIRTKYKQTTFEMLDATFGFELDLDCDNVPSERCYNELLSVKGFTDSGICESEYEWNGDITVSKKRLLCGGRDPNLSESRLDFDLSQRQDGQGRTATTGNKKEALVDKFVTLSIEDKNVFTDKILGPDRDGDNLLFVAIIAKRTDISLLLIDMISCHSRLNIHNKLYQTALHLAALTDNCKVARRLVVAGIEVEMRDRSGNTALHIACKMGSLEVAQALVTAVTYRETKLNTYNIPYQPIPQNFDIRNSEGLTCLHIAVIHKHKEMVDLLLSKDANINVIEMKAGKTCLHIAAESGNEDMVQLILSKSRPRLSTKTFAGYTATELAHYRGHEHIVYILRCKGALAARSIETIERKPVTNTTEYLYDFEEDDDEDDYEQNKESDEEDCIILD